MLRSEANLVASLKAPWGARARSAAATVLARIAGEEAARTTREIRAGLSPAPAEIGGLAERYDARRPAGREDSRELILHCPAGRVFEVVDELLGLGAEDVTVRALDYVFRPTNPLSERLFGRLS
jgi:ATP phosphoribosyltransferase